MKWRLRCLVRRTESIHDEITVQEDLVKEIDGHPMSLLQWWLVIHQGSWLKCGMTDIGKWNEDEPDSLTIEVCHGDQDWFAEVDYGPSGVTAEGQSDGEWLFQITIEEAKPENHGLREFVEIADANGRNNYDFGLEILDEGDDWTKVRTVDEEYEDEADAQIATVTVSHEHDSRQILKVQIEGWDESFFIGSNPFLLIAALYAGP